MSQKKEASRGFSYGKYFIGIIAVIAAASAYIWQKNESQQHFASQVKPSGVKMTPSDAVESFGVDLATGQVVPSQPTTNPADPYNPMPLRVGTVGATVYHYPFCPYAKQSLANHGLPNRINYWTREQVAASGRPGDTYCIARVFDCSDVEPAEFAISGNDPWCGANIRSFYYDIAGIDAAIAGKTLCSLQGRIGMFVDDPVNCVNGSIRGSDPTCDQAACGACTIDCNTACAGCVTVTVAPLNKVTFAMGDANRDGQADIDDYLYYHECYSGTIAATLPCQNVFDFDGDTDVDAIDFDLFVQAYNSGNESWAIANHPTAKINPPRPELPLRVGTEGSQYYHRIDCSAVNNSWQTHGIDLRADYFTWNQVEASGRIPDLNICLPGTRANPSGTWQNCTLDDDADGILNCDDACPLDPDKIAPGVCGCGVADLDSDSDGTFDCNDSTFTLYASSFDTAGEPADWFDTGANNNLVESPLIFTVSDQGTFTAFSTAAGLTNIHSHYVNGALWDSYEYSGKMMADGTSIGVTFFSDYPTSDTYYRLRSMETSFGISSHGSTITSGTTDTLVVPVLGTWYNFRVAVRFETATGVEISAKVWTDGTTEPAEWQVQCFDNSPTKRTQGTIGVWSMGAGSRYWDDIVVTKK